MTVEQQRLEATQAREADWKHWGPYLSDRQWGTVREDYSADGSAWDYFSHQQSHSRAYRWGEDGLLGICDDKQQLCFALALWNGQDPVLKERLFGLTGPQGNHGEDVKEYYFYLDSTPTHSYLQALYKYPQAAYPYRHLVEENQRRGREALEFELLDTGIFEENRYFDVFVDYAKAAPDDILIQISVANRGPDAATIHVLPTLWFRNTWSWEQAAEKPALNLSPNAPIGTVGIEAFQAELGQYWLYGEDPVAANKPERPLYFTENETNFERLYGAKNASPYTKDAFHRYVVEGETQAVNPNQVGTKAAIHYVLEIPAGETRQIRLRLSQGDRAPAPFAEFAQILAARRQEADDFYGKITPFDLSADLRQIQRQAFAGLLWSKQYYRYDVARWLGGDPTMPEPPQGHQFSRNRQWTHLDSNDIISMPDKWEYPWFAAWDLAFHCLPLAMVDSDFAKHQLDIMTREWYMHPNGQIPAYEWAFGDVNPPVHAWATWRVYKIEQKMRGRGDRQFLERVFQKLLLNFTWWVNRKDAEGNNVFEGGFLGLDNIGVFDRSAPLPTGGYIEQSDGTSWMAMYCLNMLTMALELAQENAVYEDMATKFFEHFVYIADAMNHIGGHDKTELWDEEDGFFYDVLHLPEGQRLRLKVRSMVGLIPLFAVETIEPDSLNKLPGFKERLEWFEHNRPELSHNVASFIDQGVGKRRLLAVVRPDKLRRILTKMLDEAEFLGAYGIRALSRYHLEHPYCFSTDSQQHCVSYEPAESSTGLFGGNSNWRGPIWFPVNYLLIESLQKFDHYLGDAFTVACPTGSDTRKTLWQVALELEQRLIQIFLTGEAGQRPVFGGIEPFQQDPHWRNYLLFHEYFHGDNGAGLGASHQTGWTGLIAKLIQQYSEYGNAQLH
ncbi:MGH1-like glycoside hydrolase domain-containing protein [Sphaerothrix gracilis]|uniref:MGH1-like glycoside hydrolase domain-containing protein n=1 Tax=Sphaerothrix gracilis TaxID=3151835 RepID=UPI0031FDDC11